MFEYIGEMMSILVGLGAAKLFGGFGDYMLVRRRVKTYWLHTSWVLLLLLMQVNLWWSFWDLHEVSVWTSRAFLWALMGPGGLVIAAYIAITEPGDGTLDLEEHYYATSSVFFGTLTLVAAWVTITPWVLGLRAFLAPIRFIQVVEVLALALSAASKNRMLHAAAMILMSLILSAILLIVRSAVRS